MTKFNLQICLVIFFLFCFTARAQEPEWFAKLKRIQTLKSSRTEIEKVFEKAKVSKSFQDNEIEFVFYVMPEGKLSVKYSTGQCSASKTGDNYKAGKGILLDALFIPENKLKLSEFKIDRKLFKKVRAGDDLTMHLVSVKLGMYFVLHREDKVDLVRLYISSDYDYLKCA